MLEAERGPSPADESWAGYLLVAGRHVLGYLLAVSAGSVIFAVMANVLPSVVYRPDPDPSGLIASIGEAALMYFMLGTVFGIPYTVLGTVAFRLWLPRPRPALSRLNQLITGGEHGNAQRSAKLDPREANGSQQPDILWTQPPAGGEYRRAGGDILATRAYVVSLRYQVTDNQLTVYQ